MSAFSVTEASTVMLSLPPLPRTTSFEKEPVSSVDQEPLLTANVEPFWLTLIWSLPAVPPISSVLPFICTDSGIEAGAGGITTLIAVLLDELLCLGCLWAFLW